VVVGGRHKMMRRGKEITVYTIFYLPLARYRYAMKMRQGLIPTPLTYLSSTSNPCHYTAIMKERMWLVRRGDN